MDPGEGGDDGAAPTRNRIRTSNRELWIPAGGKLWIRAVVCTGRELWTVVAPRIGASEGKGTLSRPLGALERVPFQRMPFAKGARWLPLWPISRGHPSQGAPFRRPSRRAFSRSRPPPHPEQGAAACAPLTESGSCTGVRRFTQASTFELCVYGMETQRTPKKTPACPQNGPKAVLRWTQNGS